MPQQQIGGLKRLQQVLQDLPPTGESGFEGLVAAALASLSGQVFRLAKSGSQFGRDASSIPARFAVAIEAKRYSRDLTTEDLIGKASVAGSALRNMADLWVLGATSEIGEATVVTLSELLQESGMSFLPLDWSERPLPPLAVLLAAARSATLSWFAAHAPSADRTALAADLDCIADAPEFEMQRRTLLDSVNEAEVGLGPLRDQTKAWLQERFTVRRKSQQSFSQFLTISDPQRPAQPRPTIVGRIDTAVNTALSGGHVIVLLGEEGAGKSWAAAQWWAALPDPPIAMFVAGRRADLLLPRDPVESIARVLADTHREKDPRVWQKRIDRWRRTPDKSQLRFVLIMDGLNEHSTLPWADIINTHTDLLHDLGGVLIATSRTVYWEREVAPRLRALVDVEKIEVPPFTDEELASELAGVGLTLAEVPARVREFIRNPRVCSIAKSLLRELTILPEQLSIEKLLLEYWRARVVERGDLVAHNEQDFEKLIRAHAKAWLAGPTEKFDRDEWTRLSGVTLRTGLEGVRNDLTEVEEGRFLHSASPRESKYEFREEVLPYALGLLINSELRQEVNADAPSADRDADDALSRIIDPIRGFDRVAEIIAAATILASWSVETPSVTTRALIRAWCSLQNVGDDASDAMRQAATIKSIPFLDIAEQPEGDFPPGFQSHTLIQLIVSVGSNEGVRRELQTRLPRWLGRWSRQEDRALRSPEPAEMKDAEAAVRIEGKLVELTPAEHALFSRVTNETAARPETRLAHLSALLLAGRPLAQHAEALFGWSFAQAVAPSIYNASEQLHWVIKLNRTDHVVAIGSNYRLGEQPAMKERPAARSSELRYDGIEHL